MSGKKVNKGVERVQGQRRDIVNKFIEGLKNRGLEWCTPYLNGFAPCNPVTGTLYKGANRLHLAYASMISGSSDPRWLTFNQIKQNGYHLKKGSKSVAIERWQTYVTFDKDELDEQGAPKVKGAFTKLIGCWAVFNGADIEGLPELERGEHKHDGTARLAERLIESSRCPVEEDMAHLGSAAYSPTLDMIMLAPRDTFKSDERFTRTLLHEMAHSTGKPLKRKQEGRFGSQDYAFEELVAELSSVFTSVDLGIQSTKLEDEQAKNHMAYVNSWISILQNRPEVLFRAASLADKATAYIEERFEKVREVVMA